MPDATNLITPSRYSLASPRSHLTLQSTRVAWKHAFPDTNTIRFTNVLARVLMILNACNPRNQTNPSEPFHRMRRAESLFTSIDPLSATNTPSFFFSFRCLSEQISSRRYVQRTRRVFLFVSEGDERSLVITTGENTSSFAETLSLALTAFLYVAPFHSL